ncbi:MAG: glutamate racemase [bacterium]|nr:glutamate racemase [bacterium]
MIGIFDSGIGGLSLYLKAKEKMPEKGFIYLSDDSNFPYGEKTEEEIRSLARKNIQLLQDQGARVVLIACNSATVSSRGKIRSEFDIPIIGVEPGIKMAKDFFPGKKTLVLATKRTTKTHGEFKKEAYKDARIVSASDLVDLVEADFPDIKKSDIKAIMDQKMKGGEEVIVLGCTHYHLIQDTLQELYPDKTFIAPEEAIIRQLEKFSDYAKRNKNDIFLTTGDLEKFKTKLSVVNKGGVDVRKV